MDYNWRLFKAHLPKTIFRMLKLGIALNVTCKWDTSVTELQPLQPCSVKAEDVLYTDHLRPEVSDASPLV